MAKNTVKRAPVASGPTVLPNRVPKPVASYTDPAALRTLMQNAKRLGRDDVWRDAFRHLCSLQGADQADPLHRDFYGTLAAYEQLLSEKNARPTRASPTRLKLRNKGVVRCIEDWVRSKQPSEEFQLLVANGFGDVTGEQLVLNYPEQFSEEAVAAATARLAAVRVPAAG